MAVEPDHPAGEHVRVDLDVMSKLSQFKVTDESSVRELKSLIKAAEAAPTALSSRSTHDCNGFKPNASIWQPFISSIQSQLSADSIREKSENESTLVFIKSLSEICVWSSEDAKRNEDDLYKILLEPLIPTFFDYITSNLRQLLESPDLHRSATALHQILGLIHKTVRTSLSVLKRLDSGVHMKCRRSESMNDLSTSSFLDRVVQLMEVMCALLQNPFLEGELDIKCSAGLGICLGMKILHGELAQQFFVTIFSAHDGSGDATTTSLSQVENEVLHVSRQTVNRIAIAFGVLNLIDPTDTKNSLIVLKCIAENILYVEHGTKEAVNLGCARILESWMLKLSAMDPTVFSEVKYVFPDIEFFLMNNLAGHIDAVKGCCRCIISLVAKVYDVMDGPGNVTLVKQFLERFLHKPPHVRWAGICWTAKSTPKSLCLVELVTSVPEMLLSTERVFINAANETYLALMGYHFEVVKVEEWFTTWIDPLFLSHKAKYHESNWSQKRTIICALLKSKKKDVTSALMKYILEKINGERMTSPEATQLAVEAVKIVAELGIQMDVASQQSTAPDSFQGIIPRNVLNSWLWSGNSQARIAAFSLIVETRKTTDPISSFNFESIKLFLQYNLVSQSPAFRQHYLSLFKKLLRRLTGSFRLLKKKNDSQSLTHYVDFFKWLWISFTEDNGLFPGANFARRCQALECLAEFTSQFDFDLFFTAPTSKPGTMKYLSWLNDSYEHNKLIGFQILEKMPLPALEDPSFAETLMDAALTMCGSVKPPESVSGRYFVVFTMKKCSSTYPPLAILTRLCHKLQDIVKMIEETSLMEVSGQTAIYGYISCVRMILAESNEYLTKTTEYGELCSKLIDVCFKLDRIFFPLLGCAAPEGTLIDRPEENENQPLVVRSLGAQKMLVCSWRSMRDACHLLNEMCSLFPLEGEKSDYILNFDQVESIGNHLLYLLKNLMHRGVFEQVFVGFELLAARLYRSTSCKLANLIDKWLGLALDEDLMSSKSVTRRSAGLPFILQALLAPGADNEAFICKYVSGLFSKESESPQVRIHVMNVLRALFRDATFYKAMVPYVPAGLRRAFKAQASNYWPEQNSGLMLLGAVVRRTFGPLLNSMSASTFFRKFPDMYEFLLGEVRSCGEKMKEKNLAEQFLDFTFYVLVLLTSFATKGVIEDAHFPLCKFIAYIRDCGASEDVRVRKIAAKALIPFLLDPANQIETINAILNDLHQTDLSAYEIHGGLCAILTVYQATPTERRTDELKQHVVKSLKHASILRCKHPLVHETLAEVCAELGQEARPLFNEVFRSYQVNFGLMKNRNSIPDLPSADRKLCAVKIRLELTDERCESRCKTIYNWVLTENLTFIEQLVSFLCSNECAVFEEEASSIILNVLVRKYVTTDFFYDGQRNIEELFLQLFCQIPVAVYDDWLKYVLDSDDGIVRELFEKVLHICEMESGTMACKGHAAELLGKLATKVDADLSHDHKERFCHVVSLLCDSNSHDQIRFGVAKCLPNLKADNNFNMLTVGQQCKLWYTLLILAQDDEYFVREEINSKYSSGFGTFCDIKLIENLTQLFFHDFVVNHLEAGLTLLVGIILRDDYIVAEEADDSEEERLFDKSEINSFNERILLAKIIREFLDQNAHGVRDECRNAFRNARLHKGLLDLYEFVSNSVVTLKSNKELTLLELCRRQIVQKAASPAKLTELMQSDKASIQNAVIEFLLDTFN